MPEGQNDERHDSRSSKGEIEAGVVPLRSPRELLPSAMPPCPSIIRKAFIRPRTHPGITRCPATQSSDPASAQATPANAVDTIKAGTWRMSAIEKRTTTHYRHRDRNDRVCRESAA